MRKAVKRTIHKLLGVAGYELHRRPAVPDYPRLKDAIARLAARGPDLFNTVIDVGASNGSWSRELMSGYPSANYLLIEAQPVHEPVLKEFCTRHKNAQYVLAAAGESDGEIFFDASDPFGGLASHVPFEQHCIRVPMIAIDSLVRQHNLAPPFLIKLDTHGFELPILRGAARTLCDANALIIECYNFRIAPECLLFYEMSQDLERQGFRCMDMFDVLYRPYDQAFWQMDMLFMRSSRPEFSYNGYR